METQDAYIVAVDRGKLDATFTTMYGGDAVSVQRQRYLRLLRRMQSWSPCTRCVLVNAPGRAELGGNHTDHNNGVVLTAAVHFDCLAVAAITDDSSIRIRSEGFSEAIEINLDDLEPRVEEVGTSTALVRGVAHCFKAAGLNLGGFDACISGNVPVGSGLSSSAAFEVCLGQIFNQLYNDGRVSPLLLAQFGQRAENVYFGKPCGLMDQLASAAQGVLSIDFNDPVTPSMEEVDFDFDGTGYQLAVVDTGGDHSDLTPDYAAIPDEMYRAAQVLGQDVVRGLTMEQVLAAAPAIRKQAGDRGLLRIIHFIEESDRAKLQAEVLRQGDMTKFLSLVLESGDSSWRLLQNCIPVSAPLEQPIPLALTLTERFLGGQGAWRIQGGGFAGTIQVYVPSEKMAAYSHFMDGIFGPGSVVPLLVRKPGNEIITLG
ncbi:MAG: galactokinase [Pseudodesulfovibrio sp.]